GACWIAFAWERPSEQEMLAKRLFELQLAQLRPARVACLLVNVSCRIGVVQALAADRAQALAVLAAEKPWRQGQDQGVARPSGHVELTVFEIGAVQLLRLPGLIHLSRVDRDDGSGSGEAAHARSLERG